MGVVDLSQYQRKPEPPRQGDSKVLLLTCFKCKSVEEIPFDNTHPYYQDGKEMFDQNKNPFLQEVVASHQKKGCPKGILADIDAFLWMSPKGRATTMEAIKKQLLQGSSGLDEMMEGFYDVKANFSADALSCYSLHNKPKGQCSDYKSERKLLKPGTDKERKELGLGKAAASGPKVYLCDFCPVKSFNMQKFNESKGLYK
jgi:hypothetical protein